MGCNHKVLSEKCEVCRAIQKIDVGEGLKIRQGKRYNVWNVAFSVWAKKQGLLTKKTSKVAGKQKWENMLSGAYQEGFDEGFEFGKSVALVVIMENVGKVKR